jgi:hypothetical protein
MQMNLTPSSKARRQASRKRTGAAKRRQAAPNRLDCADRIHAACAAIEMLSGLLAGHGEELLEAELAREAGHTLLEQIRQLRAAWNQFTKGQP